MMSTRISSFFLNRNLRPRRLEQFYSVAQSTVDEPSAVETVETPKPERTFADLKDNNAILNFVTKMKKVDNSAVCTNVIKLAKLNSEKNQVGKLFRRWSDLFFFFFLCFWFKLL